MGIIDNIKGKKKNKGEDIVLEPSDSGYALRGAHGSRITGVYVFINSTTPLKDERELLESIIKESGLASRAVPDAPVSVKYEELPGIDEYVAKGEMPESLNAFIMTRAMMRGLARGRAEMAKLAISPFDHKGVKGALILKEA